MAAVAEGKYQLRSLHEEIDLFDRKLSHLLKYESFATDSTRDAAAKKLRNRRDLLAKTARRLAAEGVEYQQRELPRSFLLEDAHPEPAEVESAGVESAGIAVPAKSRKAAADKPSRLAEASLPEILPAQVEPQTQGSIDS